MKNLFSTFIIFIALSSFAMASTGEAITSQTSESIYEILSRVLSVQTTYSQASNLDAKVVELTGGDGLNSTRVVILFNSGNLEDKIFALDTLLFSVDRIFFVEANTLLINYTQDSINKEGENIQVKKSLTIKVQRDVAGELTNNAVVTYL